MIFVSLLKNYSKELLHIEGLRLLQIADGNENCTENIETGKNGKPFFKDRHAEFNISHSNRAAALIYNTSKKSSGGAVLSTGIDIQKINYKKDITGIMEKAYSANEIEYIKNAPDVIEKQKRFYRVWVLKEAAIKLNSLSVFDIKEIPSFIDDDGLLCAAQTMHFDYLIKMFESADETYMLAAAIESATGQSKLLQQDIVFSGQ
ncbi:MAG: hypothetical protein Ta2F_19190 [Termitinemataceae bacterium]|nr:MAG: hypothetical protein Ta2F_19190 [Termitinemataceae bacterium]